MQENLKTEVSEIYNQELRMKNKLCNIITNKQRRLAKSTERISEKIAW